MSKLADKVIKKGNHVICDFVCPTVQTRKVFDADITVWMNTIEQSEYNDTNKMFVPPILANGEEVDFEIREFDADTWAQTIHSILKLRMNTK